MDHHRSLRFSTFFVFILFLFAADRIFSAEVADLILIQGNVITVDAKDSIARAVAIQNGKIVALGTNEVIQKFAGNNTRIIDLHGRTVTPGLIDAHCHFDKTVALYDLDLSNVKSISEVQELVRVKVSKQKPGSWIQGRGWDESKLVELRHITAGVCAADSIVVPAKNKAKMRTVNRFSASNSR